MNFFLIVILFLPSLVYCQITNDEQKKIDSLNQIITSIKSSDSIKANSFVELSNLYAAYNIDTVITFCNKAIEISNNALKKTNIKKSKTVFTKIIANAYNNIGYVYESNGQIEEAIEVYKKCLHLQTQIDNKYGMGAVFNNIGYLYSENGNDSLALVYYFKSLDVRVLLNDSTEIAESIHNIGYTYWNQGKATLALDYYHKSLKIQESISDKLGAAYTINNIGSIYQEQKNNELALKYYKKSKVIFESLGKKLETAYCLNNIGVIYKTKNDFEKAKEFFEKSLKIRIQINDKKGIAYSYNNLAKIYESIKDFKTAKEYYENSLIYSTELGNKYSMAASYNGLSNLILSEIKINNNLSKYNNAIKLAQKSLVIGQELGYPDEIREASKTLYELYEFNGDFQNALNMHKLFILMRDSVLNQENRKNTLLKDALYEYETQKKIDDKENEKRIALEKEKQQRQFLVLIYTVVAASVVFILLLIIYRRLQITKKQKLIIEEQKELLAETNEELNQTNEELASQRDEIERQKHIVEDQRDDIVASITYAKRIQTAILPPVSALNQILPNNFVLYQPKDVVAGDFYWLETKGDDIFIAAADCTGHGVPGAMVSVVCHGALNRCVREYNLITPSEILDKTRELVLETFQKSEEQVKDGMDISLMKINFKTRKAEWAGANNPLYILKNNEIEIIKADKQPIGYVSEPRPFTNHHIDLDNVKQIYLFTDGYADQFGGDKGKKIGYNTFREKLLEISDKEMSTQKDIINQYFSDWKGNDEQIDDVCVIGLRV